MKETYELIARNASGKTQELFAQLIQHSRLRLGATFQPLQFGRGHPSHFYQLWILAPSCLACQDAGHVTLVRSRLARSVPWSRVVVLHIIGFGSSFWTHWCLSRRSSSIWSGVIDEKLGCQKTCDVIHDVILSWLCKHRALGYVINS